MKLTQFLVTALMASGITAAAWADNELGPGQYFKPAPSGEISANRNHLGHLVEILGDGNHYATNKQCVQGQQNESVSANTGRPTWDAPARIDVSKIFVSLIFAHAAPYKKTITLSNATLVANPSDDCLGSAFLETVSIAPYYYLSLALSTKQVAGDMLSKAQRNALLQQKLSADPALADIRLKDFAEPSYITALKAAVEADVTAAGLVADGWIHGRSFVGPSEMGDELSDCRSALDGNPKHSHCLKLAEMGGAVDDLLPLADASLYEASPPEFSALLTATTLSARMSTTVIQP